jgi:hypothetical protein
MEENQSGETDRILVVVVSNFPKLSGGTPDDDFEIIVNGQADPFFDARTDVVAGHGVNFTINTPYLESYCDIPL